MPRLTLSAFLILSILLGAFAIPLVYRYLQAKRQAEIERLEKELDDELVELAELSDPLYINSNDPRFRWSPSRLKQAQEEAEVRIQAIEARLLELTGRKPARPSTPADGVLYPANVMSYTKDVDPKVQPYEPTRLIFRDSER